MQVLQAIATKTCHSSVINWNATPEIQQLFPLAKEFDGQSGVLTLLFGDIPSIQVWEQYLDAQRHDDELQERPSAFICQPSAGFEDQHQALLYNILLSSDFWDYLLILPSTYGITNSDLLIGLKNITPLEILGDSNAFGENSQVYLH